MLPHRVERAGVEVSAWCAFDPLCLARVIGDLQVTTADPVRGQAITYRIGRDDAITGASHPGSVLSFLRPDKPWGDDVQTTFCRYVHHFTGPATAQQWTPGNPRHLRDRPRRRGRTGPPPHRPHRRAYCGVPQLISGAPSPSWRRAPRWSSRRARRTRAAARPVPAIDAIEHQRASHLGSRDGNR
jgi:hypothetical protein